MKLFLFLIFAGVAFFMFKDQISGYAGKAKHVVEASSSTAKNAGGIEWLGGKRTTADRQWIYRMNAVCARRNAQEDALRGVGNTTASLARHARRTLAIWDRYARGAAAIPIPKTYAKEAAVLQTADEARRRGIEAVLVAARARNVEAAHRAVETFGVISDQFEPGLVMIGVAKCAAFNP